MTAVWLKPELRLARLTGSNRCTHIDADHIGGLLEFFSSNGPQPRSIVEVDRVWHNSLRSMPLQPGGEEGVQGKLVLEAL